MEDNGKIECYDFRKHGSVAEYARDSILHHRLSTFRKYDSLEIFVEEGRVKTGITSIFVIGEDGKSDGHIYWVKELNPVFLERAKPYYYPGREDMGNEISVSAKSLLSDENVMWQVQGLNTRPEIR